MNMDHFKLFCGKDDIREWLNKPFRVGPDLCASNGEVICVLEGQASDSVPGAENGIVIELIEKIRAAEKFPVESIEEGTPANCRICNGSGVAGFEECRECEGWGEVDLESDYSTYRGLECKSCEGEGQTKRHNSNDTCGLCEGSGTLPESETVWLNDYEDAIQKRYFNLIKDLPGLKIGSAREEMRAKQPNIAFSFEGGFGCVMCLANQKRTGAA